MLLTILRVILAAVLAVAGAAKLRDRPGTRRAVIEFGAPPVLAHPVALALPALELLTAAGLLAPVSARPAAAVAAALLALFTAAIVVSLVRGRQPQCHCFGEISSAPIGLRTVARNLGLLAIAALVVAGGRPASPWGWIAQLSSDQALIAGLGAAVAVLAAGVVVGGYHLLGAHGRLLHRLDDLERELERHGVVVPGPDARRTELAGRAGLPVGVAAPPFELESTDGERRTLEDILAPGRPALLVFTDPGCAPCSALAPALATLAREHADTVTIVPVSSGAPDAARAAAQEHGFELALLDSEGTVATKYVSPGTPSAVLISADGTVARPTAPGGQAIRELIAELVAPRLTVHRSGPPSAGPAPIVAPTFDLVTADGGRLTEADLTGQPHVLLFWRPSCGYCAAMIDRLRQLDATADGLIVVSSGSAEENAALELRAPVLHDAGGTVATAFGTGGTPMAVAVDADGRIASSVAAGAEAVLELAAVHLDGVPA